MGLQFEWWVGDRDESERIARKERRGLPRWVWPVLRAVLAGLVVLSVGGYLGMRLLYERARHRAWVQVKDTMDIEARALAKEDDNLYLAQQDRVAADWYQLQARCVAAHSPIPAKIAPTGQQDLCLDLAPAEIEDLELRGDIAWVYVLQEAPPPVRRVRFYRRTDQGWKHTAPRADFWGDPVAFKHDKVLIRYHERDRPAIDPLLDRITGAADDVSSALLYSLPISRARIEFVAEISELARISQTDPLYRRGDRVLLLSPWLSGIPVDGTWDEALLDELAYRVAHGLALAATRSSDNRAPGLLQRAISSEYAAWYVTQDPAQAPILGRLIERHGTEALPRVFLSLKGSANASLFLIRWLSVHPNDASFFETVLSIEREAIAVGQRETFLLFQDEAWLSAQDRYFDQAQIENPYPSLAPIKVLDVSLSPLGVASVVVQEPFVRMPGYPRPTDGRHVVIFRQVNWDWKHAPYDAALPASRTATPIPNPAQSP